MEAIAYTPVAVPILWIAFNKTAADLFWQSQIVSKLNLFQISCLLPFGFSCFFYFGTAFLFFLADMTGAFNKYRIQHRRQPPSLASYWKALKLVLFNFLAINLPLSFLNYKLFEFDHAAQLVQVYGPLPTIWILLRDLGFSALFVEFSFYWQHRLFHYPPLYKFIHKKHHEYTAPMGLVAIYAHPLDHLLVNMVSVLGGPFLMKSHIVTLCLWTTTAVITTVFSHSGYRVPGSVESTKHDYHHYVFNSNFGILGILDWLCGTDKGSAEYDNNAKLRIEGKAEKEN